MQEPLLGFSTGAVAVNEDLPLSERIRFLRSLGCRAVEIGVVRASSAKRDLLPGVDPAWLESFDWVSLHAPGGKWKWKNVEKTKELLDAIEQLHGSHPLDCVVVHPHEVPDLSVFSGYSFPIALENQDPKKKAYLTAQDMVPLFEQYDVPLVLDLQHCAANDSTLANVEEFLNMHGSRLKEVQVAAMDMEMLADPNAPAVGHRLLYQHEEESHAILAVLKQFADKPIIIEGTGKEGTREEIEKEVEFVRKIFV